MTNLWRDDIFDNLVRLKRGHDLPNQNIVSGKFPVVASSGIKDFHNDFKASPPIVVTGRSGTLGEVQYITEKSWPLNTTLYSISFRDNLPKYVYYYLKEMHLENFNAGAGVPTLNQNHLQKLKIKIPQLDIQKKIAAILSAYDDLIENNKKRIQILENMAEELYKEWFVRFRFPNWENTEFEKGVPRDWIVQTVNDSFAILGGGTPSKEVDEYWVDGEINWYTPSDLTRQDTLFIENSELKCNETGLSKSSAKLFPAYSIMMTSRATIGVLSINTTEACTNQGFITCIPNKEFPLTYLYFWLKFAKPYLEILASGATFAELSRGNFKKVKLFKPNELLVESFENQCRLLFDEVLNLQKQNRLLSEQKDSLLPRLIAGKLSVENLDIQFPPSIQEQ
ncbi:restriction endonuclease subunit S [Acinetobacter sp. YH01004]|uniref:restriction endonuclease subunit S n=1 Tax=Acinetobacter sp. YH01004 TaxID=2601020 RepID=UPI0015D20C34|nr:restriction endonuclease subunit S [Acinetobacter sp. YH01004]